MHKTGRQNSYKEVRSLTLEGAVDKLLKDVGSRHKLKAYCIKILRTVEVTDENVKDGDLLKIVEPSFKMPILNKK